METNETTARRPYPHAGRRELSALLVESLPSIERFAQRNRQRFGLSPEDGEDFTHDVCAKLMEDDFRRLRAFRAQAALPTFLCRVVNNHFRDELNHRWGKWRPSTAAERLGPAAVALETLLHRDGLSRTEAIETMVSRDPELERSELEALADALPHRRARRREAERVFNGGSVDRSPDAVSRRQAGDAVERAVAALGSEIRALAGTDRDLIERQFYGGSTVAAIARDRGVQQSVLYRRTQRVLRVLRTALERRGFIRDEVLAALATLLAREQDVDAGYDDAVRSMERGIRTLAREEAVAT